MNRDSRMGIRGVVRNGQATESIESCADTVYNSVNNSGSDKDYPRLRLARPRSECRYL